MTLFVIHSEATFCTEQSKPKRGPTGHSCVTAPDLQLRCPGWQSVGWWSRSSQESSSRCRQRSLWEKWDDLLGTDTTLHWDNCRKFNGPWRSRFTHRCMTNFYVQLPWEEKQRCMLQSLRWTEEDRDSPSAPMDTSFTPLLQMKSRALFTLAILWKRILPLSGLGSRSPVIGWQVHTITVTHHSHHI